MGRNVPTNAIYIVYGDTAEAAAGEIGAGANQLGGIKDVSDLGGFQIAKYNKSRMDQKKVDGTTPDLVEKSGYGWETPQPLKCVMGSDIVTFPLILGDLKRQTKFWEFRFAETGDKIIFEGTITDFMMKGKKNEELTADTTFDVTGEVQFVPAD